MKPLPVSLPDLVSRVKPGNLLALPADYAGPSMVAIVEILRQQTGDLTLLGVPQLGLQADLLIGAGLVKTVEAAAVTLGEHGLAPCFSDKVKNGQILLRDSTCPAILAGLQAAEKGVPFMPIRGILGSDLVKHRPDWKVMDNPFPAARGNLQESLDVDTDPILLLPAIHPDVALFHAPVGDVFGNVWIGVRRELLLMAHAAKTTLITVEKLVDYNLLANPEFAAGTIPSLYVSALCMEAGGAWPIGYWGEQDPDHAWLKRYAREAKTGDGFQRILNELLAKEALSGVENA